MFLALFNRLPSSVLHYCTFLGLLLVLTILCDSYLFEHLFPLVGPRTPKLKFPGGYDQVLAELLLDTPSCTIPQTQSPQLALRITLEPDFKPNCSGMRTVANLDYDTGILTLSKDFRGQACTVSEFRKPEDDTFEISDPVPLEKELNVSEKELLLTRCGNHYNLHANIPLKGRIGRKIKFWGQVPDYKHPLSVLIIGFDSSSRVHFYNSWPRAMAQMREMGFTDFPGYHSILPYTLENLVTVLMGLEISEVRKLCSADWDSPYDGCPLIWKYFDENKYVTMFTEDGSQTFNWGGQGGFKEAPTDYYLHPLFKSQRELRKNYSTNLPTKNLSYLCMSKGVNSQNFVLDYAERFSKKFQSLPTFSFIWNNDATHGSFGALAGMDGKFTSLLKTLRATTSFGRTLIVVLSDHGLRYGDITNVLSPGVFTERALPGLFIKFPDALKRAKPALFEAFKSNTNRLLTGFDINHTLKHLLILNGMTFAENDTGTNGTAIIVRSERNFKSDLEDRSSLFVPISDRRSCADLKIPSSNCVCNSTSEVRAWSNPFLRHKLVAFALKELNRIVVGSKYRDRCTLFQAALVPFVSAVTVSSSSRYHTVGVLRFLVTPKDAVFEVQLRVSHRTSSFDKVERVSDFVRVSEYGELSWCIPFLTDYDKKFKELCHCKRGYKK